jgi:hypothetical protein
MQDAKAVQFFEEVLSKTRARKIRWEPTAVESDYIAAVGGQFTLSVAEYERENRYINQPIMEHSLALKDQEGRTLTRVTDMDDGISEVDMRELYETARRQALHVDEKIESLLGALSKL